ncbi:MAG: DUF3750 domain-containing protein [Rhodospirillales bacterium]
MFKAKLLRTVAKGLFVLLVIGAAAGIGKHTVMADWRTASREPLGIAPDPVVTKEAVVQVYAARAFSWRGIFGVHTWIAATPTSAAAFRFYVISGGRARHGGSALVISEKEPDQRWFGAEPEIIADKRGAGVDDMIRRIDTAARAYPHARTYTVWPGPNSNTFTAHVARAVPELALDLPPTAIGKDYLPGGGFAAKTPSGTGYQVSLFGLLGVMAGIEEGVEVNILGLTFGIDPKDLAIKLPLAGRLGPS